MDTDSSGKWRFKTIKTPSDNERPSGPQILIVAGPSGSGKSTFIRDLLSSRLPTAVQDLVADDGHTWTLIEGQTARDRFWRQLALDPEGAPRGAILHLDTTCLYFHPEYSIPPIDWATPVTVINIRTKRRRIIRQLLRCSWSDYHINGHGDGPSRHEIEAAIVLARHGHAPDLVAILRRTAFPRHLRRKLRFYARSGCLRRLDAVWSQHLGETLAGREPVVIDVAGGKPGPEDTIDWQIVPAPGPRRQPDRCRSVGGLDRPDAR